MTDIMRIRSKKRGPVPSAIPGQAWIMCSYGNCASPGRAEINAVVEVSRDLTPFGYACNYNTHIFCSDAHLALWCDGYRERSRQSAVYAELENERRHNGGLRVPRQGEP